MQPYSSLLCAVNPSASKEGSEILKAIPNVPIVEVNPLDSFISKSLSKEQLVICSYGTYFLVICFTFSFPART